MPKKVEIKNLSEPRAIQLGRKYFQEKKFLLSKDCYQKVLDLNPENAEAYHILALILFKEGDKKGALQLIEKSIAINPGNAAYHYNLGNMLRDRNRLDDAVACYHRALSIHPAYIEALINLGSILRTLDRQNEAIRAYEKLISIKPDYAPAYNNLGNALKDNGRLEKAIQYYQKAVEINPDYAAAHNNLGLALKDSGRLDDAVSCFNQALSIQPDYTEALNNLGTVLKETGRLDQAISCYNKALSFQPDYVEVLNNLGTALKEKGELDQAVSCYNKVLSLNPDFAETYYNLSMAAKADDHIETMEALYNRKDIFDEQKMYLGFAFAKIYETNKAYDKSFEFILTANRLKRASFDYDFVEDRALFSRMKKIFTSDFFSRQKRGGCSNKSPIFILGMPRSGTTLVEQILASHPQVFGAGELTDFSIVARQFSWEELKKGSDEIVSGKADPFKKAGQDYINRVQKHADGEKFITDKMPHNFVSIGFIRLFLPNAKVIHCTRDPMDTCFSIFKHLFSGQKTHKYAYNMKELGHYYNLYLDLMEHWKITLPGYIYEIKYENLVSNQKEETRKLLEFGGLPWEEACLSFHKTKRRVATASAIQVRQPIYKDSIQLWKRYEVQLEDLQKVIGL